MAINKRKYFVIGAIVLLLCGILVYFLISYNSATDNNQNKIATDSTSSESNLQVSANDQNNIAIQSNDEAQSKLYGVNEMVIDPNLVIAPEIENLMRINGIRYLRIDPNSQYKAQYHDGGITAKNQAEFDKYKYHELGHHIYETKMSASDKQLFDGSGYASKQAIGRPGYTESDVISEDFAANYDLAMQGRINEVPEKYRLVVSKYTQ
jgi:hypothetical protein